MAFGSVLLALFISLVVKVMVTLTSFWLTVRLGRSLIDKNATERWPAIPKEYRNDLALLWWSLLLFVTSEFACGVELWVLLETSEPLTSFHSLVSAIGMSLFVLAGVRILDRKIVHFGHNQCALQPLCRPCSLHKGQSCSFIPIMELLILFFVLACIPPLLVSTKALQMDVSQYTLPFESWNIWYDQHLAPLILQAHPTHDPAGGNYVMPAIQQVIDFRVLPLVSLGLYVVAGSLLRWRKERLGICLLAMATGLLAFCYLELIMYHTSSKILLGALGHELSELWFLVLTAYFLRHSFAAKASAQPALQGNNP